MAGVEVLAPLRIETRFYPPDEDRDTWLLKLRVYPDEFSMARPPVPPTFEELDVFDIALAAAHADPEADPHASFLMLAADLGPARALWLLRHVPTVEFDGVPQADRTAFAERDPEALPVTTRPVGLPPRLDVWIVAPGGSRSLAGSMQPEADKIAADLDLSAFEDESLIHAGKLAETWWTSFERALAVGLALEIPFGAAPPEIEAIVVCGLGDEGPEALIDMQAATGRLALLGLGTPTNTVEGEPTTEMGRDARAWLSLLDGDATAASVVLDAMSGGKAAPMPLLGGETSIPRYGQAAVRALWPLLWGHSLRDMVGVGKLAPDVAEWAFEYLAPEGSLPTIRVGEQPYGLLPTTALEAGVGQSSLEEQLRQWTISWRARAAQAASTAGNVAGADTERLIELIGDDAVTPRWSVRPLLPRPVVELLRAQAGEPPLPPGDWELETAKALAGDAAFAFPLAPFAAPTTLPDTEDDPKSLLELFEDDAFFPKSWPDKLGFLGHLVAATYLLLRADLGMAVRALDAGNPIDPYARLPVFESQDVLVSLAGVSDVDKLQQLQVSGDPNAEFVIKRYQTGKQALIQLVKSWGEADERKAVMRAVLAALDTASHRVDPWVTGLAEARLRRLRADGAPYRLGAYGWVDRPRPFTGDPGSPPPPGPTKAGLLHAPSYAQALTAALLRDRAVRYPGEENWQINLDSQKVRAAMRFTERVRLGVHPYEALGLEVERLVGDWDAVRVLRQGFPLRASHQGQRCCDGARVLRAALADSEPLPAGLPSGLKATLQPLGHILDTYADLLLADGVHALVSGEAEVGFAAMEAAAGLGAPPDLRAMRTPRKAASVRVSTWAVLPPGNDDNGSPAAIADPAFAQLLDAEIGAPSTWTWSVDGAEVSLRDCAVHGADILDLGGEALEALLVGELASSVVISSGGAEKLVAANRLADLLGGGDADPLVPDAESGRDDANAAATPLRSAIADDLGQRLAALKASATELLSLIDSADLDDADTIVWLRAKVGAWRLAEPASLEPLAAGRAALAGRLAAADAAGATINDLRAAIRALVGQPRLPVIPVVSGALLGPLAAAPSLDATWLEIVAAVRSRLALLEARQLDPGRTPWPAALRTGDGSADAWGTEGPIVVAYGPGVSALDAAVGIVALDAWVDSIPSSDHTTSAAFGFNGPKSRPPQAILLAVPPDASRRMTEEELMLTVLETRLSARARAHRRGAGPESHIATPFGLGSEVLGLLQSW
jgi:hypothetical protein